jgi:hypothetical protein
MVQEDKQIADEETYRKLLRLYERLTSETVTIGKKGEVLGKIIDELKAESSLATEFKVQVRKGIMDAVTKVLNEVDGQVKKAIQESVTGEINKAIKNFKTTIDNSKDVLDGYLEDKKLRQGWIYCGVFFCGLIFLFTAYTARVIKNHTPQTFFTSEQIRTYRYGELWETMWDKISKKDQGRILDLAMKRGLPEKGSVDWIRNEYPGLSWKEVYKKFEELSDKRQ